jgi:predicted RNase H-related nuclease YkuK (DUF458 family)
VILAILDKKDMLSKVKHSIYLAAAILLMGCAGTKEDVSGLTCPQTSLMRDAASLYLMDDQNNVQTQVIFDRLGGGCRFIYDLVEQDLVVDVYAERIKDNMDQDKARKQDISYFVAILDPDEKILRKQEFTVTLDFDDNGRAKTSDIITQLIPTTSAQDAGQYMVTVGFVLTKEQLDYNKQQQIQK